MHIMKIMLLSLVSVCLAGCTTSRTDLDCSLPIESVKLLQAESLKYLSEEGFDTKCEELSDTPVNVGKYGCGLYGNSTNGDISLRTGHDCPMTLDGDYYVIFDHKTLKPKKVVLIAY